MKKKTLSSVFDTIFWGFLLVLPLVMLIIVNVQFKYFLVREEVPLNTGDGIQTSEVYRADTRLSEYGITYEVYSRLGLGSYDDNVDYDYWTWNRLTHNPVFEFFSNILSNYDSITLSVFNLSVDSVNFWSFYFTWFVIINLMHILVDLILFIPRACKKLLGRWSYE